MTLRELCQPSFFTSPGMFNILREFEKYIFQAQIRGGTVFAQFIHASDSNESAFIDNADSIANALGNFEDMRCHEHRTTEVALFTQHLLNCAGALGSRPLVGSSKKRTRGA